MAAGEAKRAAAGVPRTQGHVDPGWGWGYPCPGSLLSFLHYKAQMTHCPLGENQTYLQGLTLVACVTAPPALHPALISSRPLSVPLHTRPFLNPFHLLRPQPTFRTQLQCHSTQIPSPMVRTHRSGHTPHLLSWACSLQHPTPSAPGPHTLLLAGPTLTFHLLMVSATP